MADAPATDATAKPADNLFDTYDPQGALNGLFAPAYIKGFAPSEQAVANWSGSNPSVTPDMIDSLRMPAAWAPPSPTGRFANGVYGGGNIPTDIQFGDQQGQVDPEALRAMSHGTPYDVGARRDAIAARLLANQQAQDAYDDNSR